MVNGNSISIPDFIRSNIDMPPIEVAAIIGGKLDAETQLQPGGWFANWVDENDLDILEIRNIVESLAKKFPKKSKRKRRTKIEIENPRLGTSEPIKELTPEENLNHVLKMDRDICDLTKTVKSGHTTALIVSGRAGLGKTYNVESVLKDSKNYESFTGVVTPMSIYKTLFFGRKKGSILVFDDVNVWKDKDSANMVKAVLDSKPVRVVSWLSKNTRAIPKKAVFDVDYFDQIEKEYWESVETGNEYKFRFPNKFRFEGNVVFITNESIDKMRNNEHIEAVLSRSMSIDYSMTDEQAIIKMEQLIPKISPEIDIDLKYRLFEEIKKRVSSGDIKSVNMRIFVKIVDLIPSGLSEERVIELIEYAT